LFSIKAQKSKHSLRYGRLFATLMLGKRTSLKSAFYFRTVPKERALKKAPQLRSLFKGLSDA